MRNLMPEEWTNKSNKIFSYVKIRKIKTYIFQWESMLKREEMVICLWGHLPDKVFSVLKE